MSEFRDSSSTLRTYIGLYSLLAFVARYSPPMCTTNLSILLVSLLARDFVTSHYDPVLHHFPLTELAARVVVCMEIQDLVHHFLGLRDATGIEMYRLLSHIWLVWVIASDRSRLLSAFVLAESLPLLIKYFFVMAVALRLRAAAMLKWLRYTNFAIMLPVEFAFGLAIPVEFLFISR